MSCEIRRCLDPRIRVSTRQGQLQSQRHVVDWVKRQTVFLYQLVVCWCLVGFFYGVGDGFAHHIADRGEKRPAPSAEVPVEVVCPQVPGVDQCDWMAPATLS